MPSKLLCFLPPWLRQDSQEENSENYELDNGSILLEDLIASCDGKSNPIRHYSADELITATNNFDPVNLVEQNGFYKMFRGILENRDVLIKKMENRDLAIRDIIISMQMSTHKNVLRLLGCCLEFHVPALVHEYAAKGVLNLKGGYGDNEFLPWRTRLRIAKQVANAITYLHTAFPRPIIHRAINPTCIALDDDFAAKLFDFVLSITIPPEQSHVEDLVAGTLGYLDPAYLQSEIITEKTPPEQSHVEDLVAGTLGYLDPAYLQSEIIREKTDIYSFGVTLLVFLTGQKALQQVRETEGQLTIVSYANLHASTDQFKTIVDPKILEELEGEDNKQAQEQQLHDFLTLALLCTRKESEARPDMIDVAKELVRIEKSIIPR